MTYEEAIKEILWVEQHGFIADNSIIGTSRIKSAFQVTIEALEKQIPKKYVLRKAASFTVAVCPVCGEIPQNNYCHNCGQAIDWSDDE